MKAVFKTNPEEAVFRSPSPPPSRIPWTWHCFLSGLSARVAQSLLSCCIAIIKIAPPPPSPTTGRDIQQRWPGRP